MKCDTRMHPMMAPIGKPKRRFTVVPLPKEQPQIPTTVPQTEPAVPSVPVPA